MAAILFQAAIFSLEGYSNGFLSGSRLLLQALLSLTLEAQFPYLWNGRNNIPTPENFCENDME